MGHYQYPLIDIVIIVNQTLSYPNAAEAYFAAHAPHSVDHSFIRSSIRLCSIHAAEERKGTNLSVSVPHSPRAIRRGCFQHGWYILSRERFLYIHTQGSLSLCLPSYPRMEYYIPTPNTLYKLSISLPGSFRRRHRRVPSNQEPTKSTKQRRRIITSPRHVRNFVLSPFFPRRTRNTGFPLFIINSYGVDA